MLADIAEALLKDIYSASRYSRGSSLFLFVSTLQETISADLRNRCSPVLFTIDDNFCPGAFSLRDVKLPVALSHVFHGCKLSSGCCVRVLLRFARHNNNEKSAVAVVGEGVFICYFFVAVF